MARAVMDIDLGYKRILIELKKLEEKPFVKIGLLSGTSKEKKEVRTDGGKVKSEETTVLEVGIYNEFGAGNVPSRPFIRTTYDDNQSKWFGMTKRAIDNLYRGKTTIKQSLNVIGLQAVADMKNKFRSGDGSWAPNAPSTIKKKKSTSPLIDTGQLIASIQHQVKLKGK